MSTRERNEPVEDQVENVLGLPRFGATRNLPEGEGKVSPMGAYFERLANWEEPQLLRPHIVQQQVRPSFGVYMLWIRPPFREKPTLLRRYHNSKLAYIGMSNDVRGRLGGYSLAINPDRPPVYQVVRDKVMNKPQLAHDYLISAPSEMRATRRQWMRERCLSFQVAYTKDNLVAHDLEATLIRYCQAHDFELWNTIKYSTGVTWPRPA